MCCVLRWQCLRSVRVVVLPAVTLLAIDGSGDSALVIRPICLVVGAAVVLALEHVVAGLEFRRFVGAAYAAERLRFVRRIAAVIIRLLLVQARLIAARADGIRRASVQIFREASTVVL